MLEATYAAREAVELDIPSVRTDAPRHHVLIAGAGRSGTSFLVQYLAAAGLETHLAKREAGADFDRQANAGYEDLPLSKLSEDLPYVIKSPWSYQIIDEVLDDPNIVLDAVIVPMRDLSEAAASRVVVERRAMHERLPWMARLDRSWEDYGMTPGGSVYSLHPLDQERILAAGFHRLLERLVEADVPVRLVSFPRLAAEPHYLFRKVRDLLPPGMTLQRAVEIHRALADPDMIRMGRELQAVRDRPGSDVDGQPPSLATLDRIALSREIERVRAQFQLSDRARSAAETALKDVRSSTSWRLTRPLRALARAIGLFRSPHPSDCAREPGR